MVNSQQSRSWTIAGSLRLAIAALGLLTVFLLHVGVAQAQVFNVVYNFTGGNDGGSPYAGLTIDAAGNFYGTTAFGGSNSSGVVFKLAKAGASWSLIPLYAFGGIDDSDGYFPFARVIFGPDNALYGTTVTGGDPNCQIASFIGCGILFRLAPQPTVCLLGPGRCPWMETILHTFTGIPDGALPTSEVSFGPHGDLYGTTYTGGFQGGCWDIYGCGTVFKFTKTGGVWTQSASYSFSGVNSEGQPWAGVIPDSSDNLHGTTACCNNYYGNDTIFQLLPAGATWTENTLSTLNQGTDGSYPYGTLISDGLGNLYGTTVENGPNGTGVAFQLPAGGSLNVLNSFSGGSPNDPCGPWAALVMDTLGNLYGTTNCAGAYGYGSVFELKKSAGWQYIPLHDFTGGADGGNPYGNLTFDIPGNLWGTASAGGTSNQGVIFEYVP